jgi:uncharacterized repeat protein (TIGR01451 family)
VRRVLKSVRAVIHALVAFALVLMPGTPALADLRAPAWYDQNAVSVAPDWHFRVPVTIPSATVGATVKVDVDFAAQLALLNVSGTFDINSPRVVRSTGALSTTQEFTDVIYAGATDSAGNARGEVRFILEDAGPATYYIYFDVTQNGSKAANPQAPINGNFEIGGSGTGSPVGWTAPTVTAGIDAQIRPSETATVTSLPAPIDGVINRTTDGNPLTGGFSYLIGNRTSAGGGIASNPGVTLTRDFVVPAGASAGNLTIRYRPEGWDTGDFDPIRIDLVTTANVVLTEIVGPTAGSYATKPFAPNTNNAQATNTNSGYRQYNGYDCNLLGGHSLGMTVTCHGEPWFTVSQSLAAYAGTTVRLRIRFFSDANDKGWYHLDDVEWSVITGTLGAPQAFGVNITAPIAGSSYVPNQVVPITAQVDALPSASTTPVTANVYDSTGTLAQSGIILYNDGTHGDVTAGDAIWSNDGSVIANPTMTIPGTATNSSGWTLRVFARDATTNTGGAQNGLAHINGQPAPETQANFWNIDDVTFNIATAAMTIVKTSAIVSDPFSASNPKMIPGAIVRYCILITNNGPATASSIIATDAVPSNLVFVPGSMKSGAACLTAATVEDDNNAGADESDPIGASFSGTTLITVNASMANGATMALTFDVTVQ